MTAITQLIAEYCSIYIDDERLTDLAATDAPLYLRKMWGYLQPAIAQFNLPPEMQSYLVGTPCNPNLVPPLFDSMTYVTDQEYTSPAVVTLTDEYSDFELCACRMRTLDYFGNVILTPVSVTYDGEHGTITIPASSDNPIPTGTTFEFDFYTDGYFNNTLSPEIMDILGTCFELVWNIRFSENFVDRTPKVEDKSFPMQNLANKQNSDTTKIKDIRQALAGKMRRYEQNAYYRQNISPQSRLKI